MNAQVGYKVFYFLAMIGTGDIHEIELKKEKERERKKEPVSSVSVLR